MSLQTEIVAAEDAVELDAVAVVVAESLDGASLLVVEAEVPVKQLLP